MQGLILIDKPGGITSFGAVARIKRAAHEKRVGHTGTLDPMATGVLLFLMFCLFCSAGLRRCLLCCLMRTSATLPK